MIRVKATREGLTGKTTSSGWVINDMVPFVALPAKKALHRFIRIVNPANLRECYAIVLDTGPWNIGDDSYVEQPATQPNSTQSDTLPGHGEISVRPQAESGVDLFGRPTNLAGIDLGQLVWRSLDMDASPDGYVDWEFLPMFYTAPQD